MYPQTVRIPSVTFWQSVKDAITREEQRLVTIGWRSAKAVNGCAPDWSAEDGEGRVIVQMELKDACGVLVLWWNIPIGNEGPGAELTDLNI